MCRSIINFFLGVVTVALLVITIVLSVGYFNLTNPDFHKQNLLESGFYNFAANRAEQYINTTAFPTELGSSVTAEVIEGVPEIILQELSASELQIIVESNINNFSSYLNDRTSSMMVYIPVSKFRGLIDNIYDQVVLNMEKLLAERPVCDAGEEPDDELSCVTAEMKSQGVKQLLPDELTSEEKLRESFEASFPLLSSDKDEFSIEHLAGALNLPEENKEGLITQLARAKDLYDTSRVIVICVWAINVALILLFVLTLPKSFRAKISKVSFWLILVGLGTFVSGILGAVLSSWLVNNAFVQVSLSDYYVGLDTVARAFMNITFSKLYQQLILGGVAVLFVGVVLFMLISMTRRREDGVQIIVNQPAPTPQPLI